MKQTVVDDWHEAGTPAVPKPARPAESGSPKQRSLGRRPFTACSSQQRPWRRSVFDVWRVLLVAGMVLFALPALAGVGPGELLAQPEWVCPAESPPGDSEVALGGVIGDGWEGVVRLLLCLMFVALIAFRLWRDE